jgi:dTDP-glucose 4,6-dehydratase
MILLVTGGAGFIGANFIYDQLEKHPEDKIVCLDKLTYAGNLKTLERAMARDSFRFVRGDIADPECVGKLFQEEKPDIVVNFAAESHVDRSIEDPGLFLRTNVVGVQVLLDACLKHGVKRFHQVSTDEVYGDLPLDRPDLLFTEKTPLCASSPYSASKAAADLIALAYHRTYGLPVTITRCSNNYGPYQFPEKLIPLMISRALGGQKLPVYGKGLNVRDWLHVADHCAAIDLVMRSGRPGEVYNVGGHSERANIEVVRAILRELDKGEELIGFVTDRPGHDLRYAIDAAKIQEELGWTPTMTFDEGIRGTVQWYVDSRPWWEDILKGDYQNYYERMYANRK